MIEKDEKQEGQLKVSFQSPQRAMVAGQSIVFYKKDVCLGGAVIRKLGPSYWQQDKTIPELQA